MIILIKISSPFPDYLFSVQKVFSDHIISFLIMSFFVFAFPNPSFYPDALAGNQTICPAHDHLKPKNTRAQVLTKNAKRFGYNSNDIPEITFVYTSGPD